MTCVESLENILHQIGLQGPTVILWSVVLATMADCVKYRPNFPIHIFTGVYSDLGNSAVVRVIEQCCFNSVSNWLF